MAESLQPHALVIGETKNSHQVSQRLHLRGYQLHENPGRPTGRNSAKWGVIVAVKQGLFNVQNLSLPDALRGRAVALDLSISTVNHRTFSHRLIGAYAPWDPGGDDDAVLFWPAITDLCNTAPYSWSISGDLNVSLSTMETSSSMPSLTRHLYTLFLRNTNAIDLWQTQSPVDIRHDWTYRSHDSTSLSIIDRCATSRIGILSGSIEVPNFFIPVTDHRPISSLIVLSTPDSADMPYLPSEPPPSTYSPLCLRTTHSNIVTNPSQIFSLTLPGVPSLYLAIDLPGKTYY
ncbi:hypothetical protein CVT26_015409 [Gymnopilus dilepis]|uniref:Endonuclease/exonuclease/phosphatase domain-containing protein n=1 Tax=Gymnopilus dilepis TaxID=231916 RepID=A0A409YED3_9AGAR|nr:hypothetical protein CVT26_015409 [Gymnopilus dilepis]